MRDAGPPLSLTALIRADFAQAARQAASFRIGPDRPSRWFAMAFLPAMLCVLLHRLAHAAWRRNAPRLAGFVAGINRLFLRARIDPAADIGPGLYIPHPSSVMFAGRAGRNLVLFANALVAPRAPPARFIAVSAQAADVGDDVMVGFNAIVLGPVTIGDGARIGGGAFVTRDVPGGAMCRSPFADRGPNAQVRA